MLAEMGNAVARAHRPDNSLLYEVAHEWVATCLHDDGSLFRARDRLWIQENSHELHGLFNEQPDESSDPFLVKLGRQLADANDDLVLLFAEMLYIHLLIARDIGGSAKRDNLDAVLGQMRDPVEVPEDLDSELDAGLVLTGVAYKTYRPQQLWFFIDVMITLKELDEPGRSEVVSDPWKFRDLVDRVPIEAAYAQRNALLHLVHPDTFEDCVSRDHKVQMSTAFSHLARTDQDDVDRALLQIREALEADAGHPINFYAEPYRSQWARERIRAWEMLELAGRAIVAWDDFDEQERGYKLELAEGLGELYRSDRLTGWGLDVVRAVGRTNLVNFRPMGRLRDLAKREPDAFDAAVAGLVDADDAVVAIDGFAAYIGDTVGARGARLSIAATLLMGVDPTRFVPWRAQATVTYERLLGTELEEGGSDAAHYASYLEMLDLVVEELKRRGVELRDRLEAQSMLWVVAGRSLDEEPFSSLSGAQRNKLAKWRGEELAEDEEDTTASQEQWRMLRLRQITDASEQLGPRAPQLDRDRTEQEARAALQELRRGRDASAFASRYREMEHALPHTRKGAHQTFLGALSNKADDPVEVATVLADAFTAPSTRAEVSERIEPLVELAERTGTAHSPSAGMAPLAASAFWHLQSDQWLPLYRNVEEALSWWDWLPGYETATERYLNYLDVFSGPDTTLETLHAFGRIQTGWFPGLDPSLVERLAANQQAEPADTPDVRRNLEHVLADLKVLDRCIGESMTNLLGQRLETVTSARDGRGALDAFVAWRPGRSLAKPPPDVRVWITADGVAIGVHPGGGRERHAEAARIARERRPDDVQILAITQDGRGARDLSAVDDPGDDEFLVGRWYPGSTILGRPDIVDDLTALVTRLKPLLGAWLSSLGGGSVPITDAAGDEQLAAEVDRFQSELSYPTAKDRQRIEARTQLREVLTPEGLDGFDLDGIRQVVNSHAGGRPGPQAVLNTTINEADAEGLDRLFGAIRYLLWDGDLSEAERIDRILDKQDLGLPGLGEAVIVKLLATAHPDRWVPAFPLHGDMGKLRHLEVLGLPNQLLGTPGEQQVAANDAIRERLEPFFPGDTWGMKEFVYWLASREDVETKVADIDLIEKAARELFVSVDFLREIVDLLREKKQVILYGPPGTGKTYLARRLARALVNEDEGRYRLVQFHPSYSYEDFFKGYRPITGTDGQLSYELRQGPFARMSEIAEASPAAEHVMIIDEINRANLPKVFGELLYLLEYRDDPAYTQYRPHEPFTVPEKLYLIGTMNTADRSIALVDAAMRRRFHFVPFFPHEGEVAGLLRRWLEARQGPRWVADLLDQVNDELRTDLGGPHLQIGPSYFMVDDLDEPKVERIWKYSIHPYIEEQLFGQQERIDHYRFDAVMRRHWEDHVDELDQKVGDHDDLG
ncbi:MAG: AAA family ATPase [Nitriliruptoraceae bacterium]|nr:AAA family ATPase [Nitriliruptoraceae bacterium]